MTTDDDIKKAVAARMADLTISLGTENAEKIRPFVEWSVKQYLTNPDKWVMQRHYFSDLEPKSNS